MFTALNIHMLEGIDQNMTGVSPNTGMVIDGLWFGTDRKAWSSSGSMAR